MNGLLIIQNISGETEMNIKVLGIDIAKNVFDLRGVDQKDCKNLHHRTVKEYGHCDLLCRE